MASLFLIELPLSERPFYQFVTDLLVQSHGHVPSNFFFEGYKETRELGQLRIRILDDQELSTEHILDFLLKHHAGFANSKISLIPPEKVSEPTDFQQVIVAVRKAARGVVTNRRNHRVLVANHERKQCHLIDLLPKLTRCTGNQVTAVKRAEEIVNNDNFLFIRTQSVLALEKKDKKEPVSAHYDFLSRLCEVHSSDVSNEQSEKKPGIKLIFEIRVLPGGSEIEQRTLIVDDFLTALRTHEKLKNSNQGAASIVEIDATSFALSFENFRYNATVGIDEITRLILAERGLCYFLTLNEVTYVNQAAPQKQSYDGNWFRREVLQEVSSNNLRATLKQSADLVFELSIDQRQAPRFYVYGRFLEHLPQKQINPTMVNLLFIHSHREVIRTVLVNQLLFTTRTRIAWLSFMIQGSQGADPNQITHDLLDDFFIGEVLSIATDNDIDRLFLVTCGLLYFKFQSDLLAKPEQAQRLLKLISLANSITDADVKKRKAMTYALAKLADQPGWGLENKKLFFAGIHEICKKIPAASFECIYIKSIAIDFAVATNDPALASACSDDLRKIDFDALAASAEDLADPALARCDYEFYTKKIDLTPSERIDIITKLLPHTLNTIKKMGALAHVLVIQRVSALRNIIPVNQRTLDYLLIEIALLNAATFSTDEKYLQLVKSVAKAAIQDDLPGVNAATYPLVLIPLRELLLHLKSASDNLLNLLDMVELRLALHIEFERDSFRSLYILMMNYGERGIPYVSREQLQNAATTAGFPALALSMANAAQFARDHEQGASLCFKEFSFAGNPAVFAAFHFRDQFPNQTNALLDYFLDQQRFQQFQDKTLAAHIAALRGDTEDQYEHDADTANDYGMTPLFLRWCFQPQRCAFNQGAIARMIATHIRNTASCDEGRALIKCAVFFLTHSNITTDTRELTQLIINRLSAFAVDGSDANILLLITQIHSAVSSNADINIVMRLVNEFCCKDTVDDDQLQKIIFYLPFPAEGSKMPWVDINPVINTVITPRLRAPIQFDRATILEWNVNNFHYASTVDEAAYQQLFDATLDLYESHDLVSLSQASLALLSDAAWKLLLVEEVLLSREDQHLIQRVLTDCNLKIRKERQKIDQLCYGLIKAAQRAAKEPNYDPLRFQNRIQQFPREIVEKYKSEIDALLAIKPSVKKAAKQTSPAVAQQKVVATPPPVATRRTRVKKISNNTSVGISPLVMSAANAKEIIDLLKKYVFPAAQIESDENDRTTIHVKQLQKDSTNKDTFTHLRRLGIEMSEPVEGSASIKCTRKLIYLPNEWEKHFGIQVSKPPSPPASAVATPSYPKKVVNDDDDNGDVELADNPTDEIKTGDLIRRVIATLLNIDETAIAANWIVDAPLSKKNRSNKLARFGVAYEDSGITVGNKRRVSPRNLINLLCDAFKQEKIDLGDYFSDQDLFVLNRTMLRNVLNNPDQFLAVAKNFKKLFNALPERQQQVFAHHTPVMYHQPAPTDDTLVASFDSWKGLFAPRANTPQIYDEGISFHSMKIRESAQLLKNDVDKATAMVHVRLYTFHAFNMVNLIFERERKIGDPKNIQLDQLRQAFRHCIEQLDFESFFQNTQHFFGTLAALNRSSQFEKLTIDSKRIDEDILFLTRLSKTRPRCEADSNRIDAEYEHMKTLITESASLSLNVLCDIALSCWVIHESKKEGRYGDEFGRHIQAVSAFVGHAPWDIKRDAGESARYDEACYERCLSHLIDPLCALLGKRLTFVQK